MVNIIDYKEIRIKAHWLKDFRILLIVIMYLGGSIFARGLYSEGKLHFKIGWANTVIGLSFASQNLHLYKARLFVFLGLRQFFSKIKCQGSE